MKEVFISCWSFFSKITNIWDRFIFLKDYEDEILMVLFGLAIIFGFFIYRLCFSITFFYLYITACVLILPRIMSMQNTVAFFSVSGVIFSFLLFKCNRIGAFVMCGVIAGMIGYMILPKEFAVAVAVLLSLIMVMFFPFHSVCIFMGLFGGLGFSSMMGLPVWLGIVWAAAGAIAQMYLFRKQDLFGQVLPPKLQYYLDSKKKES
ncbi:MAG: hypothetical protein E7308_04230 [Butyrivibrio sp.]|nr:hypothetical protein [Butyrivibrio sp.]